VERLLAMRVAVEAGDVTKYRRYPPRTGLREILWFIALAVVFVIVVILLVRG
jgi:hypothetical protein